MPIYDYVCESCGETIEVIHPISAPGPSACERCGGPMKRALSAPAIVFKGSGWAKKDARDAGRAKATTPKTAEGTSPGGTAGAGASEAAAAGPATGTPPTTATTTTTSAGSGGSRTAPG